MSLKVLRTLGLKNYFSTKILLKRKYNSLFINKLHFRDYSLQPQITFNLHDYHHNIKQSHMPKNFSASNNQTDIDFEKACNETLESLCDYFEKIIEDTPQLDNPDITFSDGVLTVQLGEPYGTYVINRQTPNKQIWLSSPTSGPKRYDFNGTKWIYKHDGVSLHELLTSELSKVFKVHVNFFECVFSGTVDK